MAHFMVIAVTDICSVRLLIRGAIMMASQFPDPEADILAGPQALGHAEVLQAMDPVTFLCK